jgi:hypothetical protein
MMTCLI